MANFAIDSETQNKNKKNQTTEGDLGHHVTRLKWPEPLNIPKTRFVPMYSC